MKYAARVLLIFMITLRAFAEEPEVIRMSAESLGDVPDGVVTRVTFRLAVPAEVPPEAPLVIQGSASRGAEVVRTFRFVVPAETREVVSSVMTLPAGDLEIEARLLIDVAESSPVVVAKRAQKLSVAAANKPFSAEARDGAEAIIAEGSGGETAGAVKIRPPRRDVAPNLFIVDVDVKEPVKRVEFWVEGKKVVVRNAPPWRAEVDLGAIPKRVEVKAVGYDKAGRYIDADAFIVNERETPLEVKITRTTTPDGMSHFKLSVQNPKGREIRSVALYAGKTLLQQWDRPPYAISVPASKLEGVEFVRAAAIDDTNYEASDLVFLNGNRFMEEIDVNVVEVPVSVTDAAGAPVVGLKKENFSVFEDGKPQAIGNFSYSSELPISVGILIDRSGSMKSRMKEAKDAASAFLKNVVRSGDRAFVGGFSFDAASLAPFVSEHGLLQQQVDAIPEATGGTSLYDAIVTGLYRFRTVQGRKALIILTDGEDTTSRLPYEGMLTYARAARVPLYFIGVAMRFADHSGTSKMKSLAAETGGVAYFIKDVKQLGETYKELEADLRSQYLLTYNTESAKGDRRYRTLEVKVDRPDARVRTIRGVIP